MRCTLVLAFAVAALLFAPDLGSRAGRQRAASAAVPAPDAQKLRLPVGRWVVRFENGVVETCEIRRDGTASVVEPARASEGRAAVKGGATVIVFRDDRIERWTQVGGRLVVEHWFPGAAFPSKKPVHGAAERMR